MERSKEVLARNIRRYMNAANINQKELAEIVGVSAPTVNDWLKGKKYPRIGKVEIMANYFGCEKSDLIEEKNAVVDVEISEKNKLLAKFYYAMRNDDDFLSLVNKLWKLDAETRASIQNLLDWNEKK